MSELDIAGIRAVLILPMPLQSRLPLDHKLLSTTIRQVQLLDA